MDNLLESRQDQVKPDEIFIVSSSDDSNNDTQSLTESNDSCLESTNSERKEVK